MITHSVVATDRPDRYAKQLVSHFSRKCAIEEVPGGSRIKFAPEAGPSFSGLVLVVPGEGSDPGTLVLVAEGENAQTVERAENVLGGHLVRFGEKDGLVVEWHPGDFYKQDATA